MVKHPLKVKAEEELEPAIELLEEAKDAIMKLNCLTDVDKFKD